MEEIDAEGLVEKDKVGIKSLYWAFQSTAGQKVGPHTSALHYCC